MGCLWRTVERIFVKRSISRGMVSLTHKKCRPCRVGIFKSFCRSLRWHYPDQVQRVGDYLGPPLSWTRPSSPRRLTNFTQSKYRPASPGSQPYVSEPVPPFDPSPSIELRALSLSKGSGRGCAAKWVKSISRWNIPYLPRDCPEIYVDKSV